jgi:hypothetical protein
MKDVTPRRRRRRSPLIAGLVMIAIGAILLSVNLGYGVPWTLLQYYPVILLVLGLIGTLAPSRHLSRSGGIWLLAAGIYCGVSEFNLLGLGWGSAWPLFIIAYGLEVVFGTRCLDREERERKLKELRGKHEV